MRNTICRTRTGYTPPLRYHILYSLVIILIIVIIIITIIIRFHPPRVVCFEENVIMHVILYTAWDTWRFPFRHHTTLQPELGSHRAARYKIQYHTIIYLNNKYFSYNHPSVCCVCVCLSLWSMYIYLCVLLDLQLGLTWRYIIYFDRQK